MRITIKKKKILKKINLIGETTKGQGFNIEIYDDGSVEKKYLLRQTDW